MEKTKPPVQFSGYLAFTSESPMELLWEATGGEHRNEIVTALVSHLRRPNYSLSNLFSDMASVTHRLQTQHLSRERLQTGWQELDQTVRDCLMLTSVPYEKLIDNTLHAYCEFDEQGIVINANAKMLELAADCVGQDLLPRFGAGEAEVRHAFAHNERRLFQLEIEHDGRRCPVLAEFGKIDTGERTSGYALLVDTSMLVEAEHKALEAAPFPVVKVNASYKVIYANRKAADLYEMSPAELHDKDLRDYITDEKSRNEVMYQSEQREKGVGAQYEIILTKPKSGKSFPVRVASVPSFDPAGRFSGALISIHVLDHEKARSRIANLMAAESDARPLFMKVMAIAAEFVSFDWAQLSVYTPDRTYSRVICLYPPDDRPTNARWFPIPDGFRNWINRPAPWTDDLETELNSTPEGRQLVKHPDVADALKRGVKSIIAVPIILGGGVKGVLSLQSKRKAAFDGNTRKELALINIMPALDAVMNAQVRAEEKCISDIMSAIAAASDTKELAKSVVTQLARFYEFQNVSLLKVNAVRGCFILLAQETGNLKGKRLPDNYEQKLTEGLLGLAYESGTLKLMKDHNDGSEEARRFKDTGEGSQSALSIPIKLQARVLWLLNLEDHRTNAFAPPEIQKLETIIREIESTLEHFVQRLVLEQVLEMTLEGVIISTITGDILRCNKTALSMLGLKKVNRGTNIAKFLQREKSSSEDWDCTPRQGILSAGGKKTPVLVSRFNLPDEYDHVVWFLQDVSELQWQADFETLKAALAEATAQVRVPLSLVSSFVRQIGEESKSKETRDLIDKTVRQLGKIELTYDRVLASYAPQSLPAERNVRLDIKMMLDQICSDLPETNRDAIRVSRVADGQVVVSCDPYRLLFALESMLTYLLRARAYEEVIKVDISAFKGMANITMTGHVQRSEAPGYIAREVEQARTEMTLGETGLVRFAEENKGSFKREHVDGSETLEMRLPAVSAERTPRRKKSQ